MKNPIHKLGASKPLRSTRAFTLTEILIAAGISVGIIGTLFAGYTLAAENGKASSIATAAKSVKDAVTQFAQEHGNVVPITEAQANGQIPVSGAAFGSAAIATISNACTLEPILLTEHAAERPINIPVGPNLVASNPSAADVVWDAGLQSFRMSPDAVPTRDYSNSNRVECRLSNTAAAPETAAGANFYLDGTTGIASGRRIIYITIPRCPASLAYKISRKIDGDNFSTNETTLDRKGAVVYDTPVAGATTVVIYVLDV